MENGIKKGSGSLALKIALGIVLAVIILAGGTCAACTMCAGATVAAVGVSGLDNFQCQQKQSEARGNLFGHYVAQEAFRAEKDRYSTKRDELGWTPKIPGSAANYDYMVTSATSTTFTATATGIGTMAGDVWTINEKNELTGGEKFCSDH